jgi:surface polysaccharide O-acyltransferase-like enzyme
LLTVRKKNYYFVSQNSILILITSLSLFLLFRKKVFHSRVVNYISSAALTIYLLHDSSSRNLMWKLLGTSNLALDGSVSDGNILLNLLLSITIIFIAGLIFKIIEDTVILLFKKCVRIKDRNVC